LRLDAQRPPSTTVYSSNSGVWPGSAQPGGLFIRAMLTLAAPVATRPKNSSMSFGGFPAAGTTNGVETSWDIGDR
jgi:hypothetical protein